MAGRRRSKSAFRALIRSAYRILGAANTASHVLSGDPGRIAKHMARRRTVRIGGRMVK